MDYTDFNQFCDFVSSFINQIKDDVLREQLEHALDTMMSLPNYETKDDPQTEVPQPTHQWSE